MIATVVAILGLIVGILFTIVGFKEDGKVLKFFGISITIVAVAILFYMLLVVNAMQ